MKYLLLIAMVVGLAYGGADIDQAAEPMVAEQLDNQTMGERNALEKALDYLDLTPFSREGLIDQLEYEGFSRDEAVYAVDHCGADWNAQAARKAQSYLDLMSFSRSGLIDQLEHDGFTHRQAVYGVEAVGY
jgi:hypothetical protein